MQDYHQHSTYSVTGKIYSSCNRLIDELNAEDTAASSKVVCTLCCQSNQLLSSSSVTASSQILEKQTYRDIHELKVIHLPILLLTF